MVANDKLSEEIKFFSWSQQTAVGCSSKPQCFRSDRVCLIPYECDFSFGRGRKFLSDQKYTNKGKTLRSEGNLPFYE